MQTVLYETLGAIGAVTMFFSMVFCSNTVSEVRQMRLSDEALDSVV